MVIRFWKCALLVASPKCRSSVHDVGRGRRETSRSFDPAFGLQLDRSNTRHLYSVVFRTSEGSEVICVAWSSSKFSFHPALCSGLWSLGFLIFFRKGVLRILLVIVIIVWPTLILLIVVRPLRAFRLIDTTTINTMFHISFQYLVYIFTLGLCCLWTELVKVKFLSQSGMNI